MSSIELTVLTFLIVAYIALKYSVRLPALREGNLDRLTVYYRYFGVIILVGCLVYLRTAFSSQTWSGPCVWLLALIFGLAVTLKPSYFARDWVDPTEHEFSDDAKETDTDPREN